MKQMSYGECLDYIRSDYYRITGRKNDSIFKMWTSTILDGGFRFLFWFRLTRLTSPLGWYARIRYRIVSARTHIVIERSTEIGFGCRIVHGGPCVINASAKIGDNVDIYQYVTIGSMFFHAATIGDCVYIGPSVCIVEDVKIGDRATIGAGAVVVKDVAAGSTVAGNPAHVISEKEPGRLIWHRWNREWNKR